MTKLTFKTLEFEYHGPDKHEPNGFVRAYFMKNFYFDLSHGELIKIAPYKIAGEELNGRKPAGRKKQNSIVFETTQSRAERRFNDLISSSFARLKSRITGKKTTYIHKNSGIPLIGNNSFGIVDRNSSLIEIKPVTGCNLACIFCSVDEQKRGCDFLIERDYLVEELKKIIEFKDTKSIQVFIGAQGEPLIYSEIIELVEDLAGMRQVKEIILSTNGLLLNENLIEKLAQAGLTRINLSFNSLDEERARKICGPAYNLKYVKRIAERIAKTKQIDLMLTPVLVPNVNDCEIEELIEYAIKIGAGKHCPPLGIQKFLEYQYGKKPASEEKWEDFYARLAEYEKKYGVKLTGLEKSLNIVKTKKLPKPFEKGDVVKAEIKCEGRLPGETIAAANGRNISIMNCRDKKGIVRVRITRSKHNVFVGNLV